MLFVGADYETRPVRFCAHRHARGHRNSPPDCCYPGGLPCSSLAIIVKQKKQGKKPCFIYWSGLRDSPGALLRAPARTRAPQQSPGLLLPWRVALFESRNNCKTKKARQKALLYLLERITRLARCASARTGTHAGTATVPRTVATLTGCPVRVSQYCKTKKARQKALCFLLERITRLARCASARTGTHAGTATVPRTVATLAGCPVRVS